MAGNELERELDVDGDLRHLVNDLSGAKHKVSALAVQLGIKKATRDSIPSSTKDTGDMLIKVLEEFLQGNGSEPVTRETIIGALKSVELPFIAQEMRRKYSTSPTGTSEENRERSGGESEVSEDTGDNQDATSSGYESHRNDDLENQQSKPEGLKRAAKVFEENKFGNLTKKKLRRMQTHYSAVIKRSKESFKRRNVSVQEVTETTDRYNDQPEVTALKGISTMDGVWDEFKKHTKWYNSDVVEAVIDVSGVEQDRKTFGKFKESRRGFLRHLDSNPDQCHKAQITLKLEERFERFSDKRLEQVCLTLCDLLDGTKPCPINVEEGCVKATFAIPIDVAKKHFPLSSSMERKFHKALPTLVRLNYFISSEPLEISNHSSMAKQAERIPDEGFDEVGYDASASESEEEEMHQTAPKALTHKFWGHRRVSTPLTGIALVGLMILTLLAIQVLAVNLGIFVKSFDGTLVGNPDRNLACPGFNVTTGNELKRELDVDGDLRHLSEAKHKALALAVQLDIKKATRDAIASSTKDLVLMPIFVRSFDGTLFRNPDRNLGCPVFNINDTEICPILRLHPSLSKSDIFASNITTLFCGFSNDKWKLNYNIEWHLSTEGRWKQTIFLRFFQYQGITFIHWSQYTLVLCLHDIPESNTFLGQYIQRNNCFHVSYRYSTIASIDWGVTCYTVYCKKSVHYNIYYDMVTDLIQVNFTKEAQKKQNITFTCSIYDENIWRIQLASLAWQYKKLFLALGIGLQDSDSSLYYRNVKKIHIRIPQPPQVDHNLDSEEATTMKNDKSKATHFSNNINDDRYVCV